MFRASSFLPFVIASLLATETLAADPKPQAQALAAKPTGVELRASLAQDAADIPIRGIVKSRHETTIATEFPARILKLPFRDGQRFAANDVLVDFECEKQRGELAAAEAEFRGKAAARDNSRSLRKLNAAGSFDVTLAEADAERAEASVAIARFRVKQCQIKAPFSGRISELMVNQYDMPAANGTLMRIVDDQNLEIELIAPSSWLRWLKTGTAFTLTIDETEGVLQATVSQIGATVDAVSQTIKLTGVLTNAADAGVLPGMSGTASFANVGQ